MSSSLILEGKWQDGASSASCPATVTIANNSVCIQATNGQGFTLDIGDLSLSPRIGRTPRYISFSSHAGQFECLQFDKLDELDGLIGSPLMRVIHRMENHLGLVCLATVTVLLLGFSYFYWGIPYASNVIAQHLPAGTLQQASDDTLKIMRKQYLEPSQLPEETQLRLREKIRAYAPNYPIEKLYFYASDKMGANAFALPDGTIVFTDDIIELTNGNDDEVLAVFGHELGHVEGRHALRQILQNSAIAVTIAMIGGDVSALGDIVLTLPIVFNQLAFSRKFELEADRYAGDMLEANGIDRSAFASILTKLHNSHRLCEADDTDCQEKTNWFKYLSTHPHLDQRIDAIAN